jgi:glutathione S-transferase
MLKLLGRSSSINVRKVLWTCAELQLEIEHEECSGDDLKTPAFLALNPNALVPVLQDDELVLSESNTICRYLVGREGRTDLLPAAPVERAVVEQWMDWMATDLNSSWSYAFQSLVRKSPDRQDPKMVDASIVAWNRNMRILEGRLAGTGAYVAGPTFTLADIVVGLASYRWTMTPIERPDLPAVAAWMQRLDQREPYRRHAGNGVP